jgi:hypothetical protein
MLHEVGHSTGVMSSDIKIESSMILNEEFSWLEESRADTFSMYAAIWLYEV